MSSVFVPYELTTDQVVSRFIYSSRNISVERRRIKPGAFNPSPYDELSVIHATGLADNELWEIGDNTLGTQPGRNSVCGRADIPVKSLTEKSLRAIRDNQPFDRHTSVVDWPTLDDPDQTKQLRKQVCLELSQDEAIVLVIANE
jgi:hypothetical protein